MTPLDITFAPSTTWAKSYTRTRHHNIRCFPFCLPVHKQRSFCGQSIPLDLAIPVTDNEGKPFTEDSVRGLSIHCCFRSMRAPLWLSVGQECTYMRRAEHDEDLVLASFLTFDRVTRKATFEARPPRKWRYEFQRNVPTSEYSEALDNGWHAFSAFVVDPRTRTCIGHADSPAFRVISSWKQQAPAGADVATTKHKHPVGVRSTAVAASRSNSSNATPANRAGPEGGGVGVSGTKRAHTQLSPQQTYNNNSNPNPTRMKYDPSLLAPQYHHQQSQHLYLSPPHQHQHQSSDSMMQQQPHMMPPPHPPHAAPHMAGGGPLAFNSPYAQMYQPSHVGYASTTSPCGYQPQQQHMPQQIPQHMYITNNGSGPIASSSSISSSVAMRYSPSLASSHHNAAMAQSPMMVAAAPGSVCGAGGLPGGWQGGVGGARAVGLSHQIPFTLPPQPSQYMQQHPQQQRQLLHIPPQVPPQQQQQQVLPQQQQQVLPQQQQQQQQPQHEVLPEQQQLVPQQQQKFLLQQPLLPQLQSHQPALQQQQQHQHQQLQQLPSMLSSSTPPPTAAAVNDDGDEEGNEPQANAAFIASCAVVATALTANSLPFQAPGTSPLECDSAVTVPSD